MTDIDRAPYGTTADGQAVEVFTLTGATGVRARVINFGAILAGLDAPDRDGRAVDVTLGYDTLAGWEADASYLGATVGRYANRIGGARFTLDGRDCALAANDGANSLHGGAVGFNKRVWSARPVEDGVKLTYLSPDGEEGYPGNLSVTVTYTLSEAGELRIDYTAATDRPTVCNLTNHAYWNLSGPVAGSVLDHVLTLGANQYTPVDDTLIPTGELRDVAGGPLDFTSPHALGERIGQVPGGYDHNFVVRRDGEGCVLAARVVDPATGRVMEVHTTEPGIQLYTGNFLDGSITGKAGLAYAPHGGFCLEAQKYPDTPNQPAFPPATLRPGETYRQTTVHKFSTE